MQRYYTTHNQQTRRGVCNVCEVNTLKSRDGENATSQLISGVRTVASLVWAFGGPVWSQIER